MSTESFAEQVWRKLAVIDVSNVIEQKGKLDYVSWASCWTDIKRVYPEAEFERLSDTEYPDGSVDTMIRLTIRKGDDSASTIMWLPVMDMRGNAIMNPTSRQRSDAAMRCIVKAAAVHGYGLSLWRGTELVDAGDFTAISLDQADELRDLLNQSGVNKERFLKAAGTDRLEHIQASRFEGLKKKLESSIKTAKKKEPQP